MPATSRYTAITPDSKGYIAYSAVDDKTWATLYEKQIELLPGRACDEYLDGLEILNMPRDRAPQCADISRTLQKCSGWTVVPVPALIGFTRFFEMLASQTFPAASFMRRPEDLAYLPEPDLFHEIFGHAPLLTDRRFAEFSKAYGEAGLKADKQDHAMLARLYWFTVEFGLIERQGELRAYGAGILSSPGETIYALESNVPARRPLDPIEAMRTPYRIDIFQSSYFVIQSFDVLYQLAQADLLGFVREAKRLGLHKPLFPPAQKSA